jgi:murein DD-endopeptidase MepM/ murein hydrolase activator NlpD
MNFFIAIIEKLMRSRIFNIIMAVTIVLFISHKLYIAKYSNLSKKKLNNYKNIEVTYKKSENQSENYIKTKDYIIKKGDNILNILILDLNIDQDDYIKIISAIKKLYNPNKLKIGQIIKIKSLQKGHKNIIQELVINPYENESILVKKNYEGGYIAKKIKDNLEKNIVKYGGKIDSKKGDNGIFDAMIRIGIPAEIVNQFITMYGFDIDFGRDIQDKTKFEVLFERYYNPDNVPVEIGNILYSSIHLGNSRRKYAFYLHKIKNREEYFDIKGSSIRKSLLKTPINGARVSSRFGMRRHPILGYSRMHKGIDFAARTGTPIFAAGSGVVNYSGWNGAYGKYVRIKHNSEYKTAYAHLSKIPSTIKKGKKVKQGSVIGYVGSTGRSTGPHLHYEIIRRGKQINPSKMKSTPGIKLSKKNLKKFRKQSVEKINKLKNTAPNLNESI